MDGFRSQSGAVVAGDLDDRVVASSTVDLAMTASPPRPDNAATPGDRIRELVSGSSPLVLPGVWDVLTARLCGAAGFGAVFVSGFCVAGTALGVPDVGLLTQTEMAEVARRIHAGAPDVLAIVDADTGYGNALNVARTVELWEHAGAAGLFLEDQVWPKRCGHMSNKAVVPEDEWLVKLRAACDHRTHLHVTARTDARAVMDLDAAIERGRMARDHGVDAVFIEAPRSVAELEAIATALPDVALVANMVERGHTPLLSSAELGELGYSIVVSPLSVLLSAVHAMERSLGLLRETGTLRDELDTIAGFDEFTATVGLAELQHLEDRYRV